MIEKGVLNLNRKKENIEDKKSFFDKKEKDKYEKNWLNKLKKYPIIALYGIGESASYAINYLKKNSIHVDYIFDDDPQKNNSYSDGVLVTLPKYENQNIAIVVTCSYYNEIREKLLLHDPKIDQRLFMFDGYFRNDYDFENIKEKDKEKILHVYKRLADDKSRKVFEKVLKYRYIRDKSILSDIFDPEKNRYFDKVVLDKLKSGVVIDAGACNGIFIKRMENYSDICNYSFYLFEPNIKLVEKMEKDLINYKNKKIFHCALCDVDSKMKFVLMPTATSHILDSKYSSYNSISNEINDVSTYKLDSIIKNEIVTLIKADIEGSEQSFIKGAKNTIIKNKPILLLSVYHKANDLWELLCYIDSLNLGYKFYMRHYSLSVAKTILYCVIDNNIS